MQKLLQVFIAFYILFLSQSGYAQTYSVSGTIKDNSGQPVPAAAVSVLRASDSSWLKSELAGDSGAFTLEGIAAGNYILAATALCYNNAKQLVVIKNESLKDISITMQKNSTALNEVTVSAQKPFIELGLGKIVVNVENSITNTGSVLDLLKKSPGIQVGNNGTISMHGKSGVLVLIDDRPTYMTPEQLADYLKVMSADEIAQLELITQPSAKYDAEGNSGIINIKTKKSRKQGLSGVATVNYSQGIYPGSYGSFRLSYNKNKFSFYSNMKYSLGIGFADWYETDYLKDTANGTTTNTSQIHSTPKEHFSNTTLRVGADYNYANKTTIGMAVSGNYHPNIMNTVTASSTQDDITNALSYNNRYVHENVLRTNAAANGYLKYVPGKDKELYVNLDYISYYRLDLQDVNSIDYDSQMQALPNPQVLKSSLPIQTQVYSAKADYTITLPHQLKIETGLKSGVVTVDYNADYKDLVSNVWVQDSALSNHFLYRENLNAVYLNANKIINEKWQLQVGLRTENDNVYGRQFVHNEQFNKANIALFPTAYLSYKLNDKNQVEINYGRRVDRPVYMDLNPFKWFTFYNNYRIGNPNLQPEYTDKIELKHSYKNTLITALSFSNTVNGINSVTLPIDSAKALYWTVENIAKKESASFSMTFNKLLLKWWNLMCSSDVYYSEYNGEVGDEKVNTSGFGSYFSMDSQFTISKKWSAEVNGNYSTGGRELNTFSYPNGSMSFGVSKKVLKDSGTLKLSVHDIFYSEQYHAFTDQNNFNSNTFYRSNSRACAVSFNYNFGRKKDNAQRKDNSLPDETKRMNM